MLNNNLTQLPEIDIQNLLLYGAPKLNDSQNNVVLKATDLVVP